MWENYQFPGGMVFTPEQKIKIVQFWDETKSYITVRRLFCHEFELLSRDAPSSKLIMIFVQHLDSTGIVQLHNTHKSSSTVTMSQANIDSVRESVAASPPKSYHHRSQELGLSHTLLLVVVCLPLVDIM